MKLLFSSLLLCLSAQLFAQDLPLNSELLDDKNTVVMQTNFGDIVIELNAQRAPKTVENFKKYINTGFYKNVVFHRIISNFMIQAGGYTTKMEKKTATFKVENESIGGLPNIRGSISMARTSDPHSASSQFFINVQDNPSLDSKNENNYGYTVFGQVVEGLDVVDKIKMVKTQRFTPPYPGAIAHQNSPIEPVIIEQIYFKGAKRENEIEQTQINSNQQTPAEQDESKSQSGFVTLLFSLIAFLFTSIRKVSSKCSKCRQCKKQEDSQ